MRYYVVEKKPYGCMKLIGDSFMTLITGGLWLIFIFVREMRNAQASRGFRDGY